MLDRPIPKTAKLGIAGMLVVFALGAFLLPMAKADDGVADSFVVRKQPKAKTEAEINTLQEQIERLLEQLQSLRQQIKQQEQQAKLPEEPQELVEQVDEIERSEQMHQWQQGEDMQKWQEEIKNWQNSDEFRQWQEQMERWTKDNAKAFGKAEQNLRRAKELNPSPSPAPAPSPMPVMPSIPPMPPMPQIPLEVRPSPEQISKSMPHVEPPKETIRQLQKIVTEKIALEQEIRKLHAELKQKQQLGNISDHEVEDLNDKIGALEQKLERVSDHSEELAEQIEDWGDEVGERVTVWSEELREKFEQQYENRHEEGLEQHEQQMEHFGHQMEQWSEQFAGQMEQWAEQFSSGIEISLEKLKDELDVIDEATDEITDESQDDGDKVIFRKNPDEFTITLAKGKQIVVNNQVGSIELHRGQAGQLKGTAAVRAKADTMNLAKQMAEQVKMQVDEDDKTLTLTVIKSGKQNWKGLNVDLDIQVPQNVKIKVKNNIGNVKISGLEGKIECTTNVGNIDADSLQGKIRLVTDVGKIYYDAPDDISAVVKASANVGSIVTDLPLDVKKSGFTASKATGTLGAGDDKIELVTQVGSISVR